MLVVITTLELDSTQKRFKADRVERLKSAAAEWASQNPAEADGYLLMNRPKSW